MSAYCFCFQFNGYIAIQVNFINYFKNFTYFQNCI